MNSFIRARLEDAKTLFDWRNDPITREGSHDSRPLVWEEHLSWFEQSLKNPGREIFFLKQGDQLMGMIRRDRLKDENGWLLSWMVNPSNRGKGIGKILLLNFITENPDLYFAEIKDVNLPSIKMVQAVGFMVAETSDGYQRWRYPAI